MYNAAFFDVDGTLQSFTTKSVPPSAIKALGILRNKGLKVFLATGRHKSELKTVREHFEFDAYITLNGQYCFDNDGVYHRLCMDRDDVAIAVAQAKQGLYPCYFVEENRKYVNEVNTLVEEVCQLVGVKAPEVRDPEEALSADIYQLSPYILKGEEHLLMGKTRYSESTRWHPYFIDVVPMGGSKQAGINATLERYGMDNTRVIAFGDGENDIAMLAHAKTGVAMGNAGEEVKKAADYVTDDVDDDGVLNAVLKFVGHFSQRISVKKGTAPQ